MSEMTVRTSVLLHGDPAYTGFLRTIRQDRQLVRDMERDAEAYPAELDVPGTILAMVHEGAFPLAWAAVHLGQGKAFCNYERRGARGRGYYARAYRARHEEVISRATVPLRTFLFPEPIPLHLADGWSLSGLEGTGRFGHHWRELVRPAR